MRSSVLALICLGTAAFAAAAPPAHAGGIDDVLKTSARLEGTLTALESGGGSTVGDVLGDVLGDIANADLPRLRLTTQVFDIASLARASTPSITVPPRYGWLLDDGRAFWFSAGASSVVALGTHVLVGLPVLLIGASTADLMSRTSPAALVPFLVGLGGGYMLLESALSALAATLVFNSVSKVYDANYLVSLGAHVAGSLLGAGVSALSFGVGFMLIGGLNGLKQFAGSGGVGAVVVFSFLGALPAVVVGGIALVGVPALIGAWAMSVSATPKEGYAINPRYADPPATSALPPSARSSNVVTVQAPTIPILTLPLPG